MFIIGLCLIQLFFLFGLPFLSIWSNNQESVVFLKVSLELLYSIRIMNFIIFSSWKDTLNINIYLTENKSKHFTLCSINIIIDDMLRTCFFPFL